MPQLPSNTETPPQSGRKPENNVAFGVLERLDAMGDRPAVDSADSDETMTGTAMARAIRAIAAALRAAGIVPGCRVGLCCDNKIDFVAPYFGILQAGGAAVALNYRLPPAYMAGALAQANVRGVIACRPHKGGDASEHIAAILEHTHGFVWTGNGQPAPESDRVRPLAAAVQEAAGWSQETQPTTLGEEASIVSTSGTTGPGKGVRISHGNVLALAGSVARATSLGPASKPLIGFPLSSSFGQFAHLTGGLIHGAPVTVHQPFNPERILHALTARGCTHFAAVPTVWLALVPHIRALQDERALETLRQGWFSIGAAPVPASITTMYWQEFGIVLRQGYGLSETSAISAFAGSDAYQHPDSTGKPIDCATIEILDPDGQAVPPGTYGEVVISGKHIMLGYVGSEPLPGQRLHTGDVGYMDEDGRLYIVDRLKDLIIRGGENVLPREVESCLLMMPEIAQAAVVGKPDERYGEVPVAFLVAADGEHPSSAILRERLAATLPAAAVPVGYCYTDSLPLGPTGKVLKRELRQRLDSM